MHECDVCAHTGPNKATWYAIALLRIVQNAKMPYANCTILRKRHRNVSTCDASISYRIAGGVAYSCDTVAASAVAFDTAMANSGDELFASSVENVYRSIPAPVMIPNRDACVRLQTRTSSTPRRCTNATAIADRMNVSHEPTLISSANKQQGNTERL